MKKQKAKNPAKAAAARKGWRKRHASSNGKAAKAFKLKRKSDQGLGPALSKSLAGALDAVALQIGRRMISQALSK